MQQGVHWRDEETAEHQDSRAWQEGFADAEAHEGMRSGVRARQVQNCHEGPERINGAKKVRDHVHQVLL